MAELPTTFEGKLCIPRFCGSANNTGVVNIAVIGGTGLQKLDGFVPVATVNPLTPWGYPSAPIHIFKHNDASVAFLSRHGAHHQFAPHEVPNQANIAALRSIGVRTIIAFSAVGSLQEEIRPRDFVVPDQVIDRTKGKIISLRVFSYTSNFEYICGIPSYGSRYSKVRPLDT